MKKLTLKYVKNRFIEVGCRLLSTEYKDASQKLEYICSNGHRHFITWHDWSAGHGCPYCAGNAKLTIEFIRYEFEKENWVLESTEYVNRKQKLDCVCPNGHEYSITWNNWRKGHGCSHCYNERRGDSNRFDLDFIKSEFEGESYELLTREYKDTYQKLEYICPNRHRHSITWNNWQQGGRCPTCYRINNVGSNHPHWKGGITSEPYCPIWLEPEFKQMILERDNHQCQNPDCWGTSKKLCGHHIDYNKKNCNPSNIITTCYSCNGRANKNRERWTKFYHEIMNEKQGHVYE